MASIIGSLPGRINNFLTIVKSWEKDIRNDLINACSLDNYIKAEGSAIIGNMATILKYAPPLTAYNIKTFNDSVDYLVIAFDTIYQKPTQNQVEVFSKNIDQLSLLAKTHTPEEVRIKCTPLKKESREVVPQGRKQVLDLIDIRNRLTEVDLTAKEAIDKNVRTLKEAKATEERQVKIEAKRLQNKIVGIKPETDKTGYLYSGASLILSAVSFVFKGTSNLASKITAFFQNSSSNFLNPHTVKVL